MSTATASKQDFLEDLENAFEQSTTDFARAYYLFATAKLSDTYNSSEIYERYPLLTSQDTFHQLKAIFDEQPDDEVTRRLFTSVLGTYIGNKLAKESDAFENKKNQLKINVADLGIKDDDGQPIEALLYEDVSEWLKKIEDKPTRQQLYDAMAKAFQENLAVPFMDLFLQETKLMAELGYPDVIDFYSKTSGHDLRALADIGKGLVADTQNLYTERMAAFYKKRTGLEFSEATRADISYVLHGKLPELTAINAKFTEDNMLPLAKKTFDGMGLAFSDIAQSVDFQNLDEFNIEVVHKTEQANGDLRRILLDVTKREGKRSRAFVYPAKVPSEIYLSVKPEGGLDDYSAFFHESGHAHHFAYEDPGIGYAKALMGNNTVTEAYAYCFQNLFLNRHWLTNMAGLSPNEAKQVVQRGALNDLYMLRRYSSKMQFEIKLYDNVNESGYTFKDKAPVYTKLLTLGCGFQHDAEGWTRDVDAGFYVADYFTAWALEAQLREYLCKHFGNEDVNGEDWYTNKSAGAFLKDLWKDGNLHQQDLSARLGYNNPNDVGPLLRFMDRNLN